MHNIEADPLTQDDTPSFNAGPRIAEDGSNFWGVHVDQAQIDGVDTQIILASDRNLGLYVFTFSCDNPDGALYCDTR